MARTKPLKQEQTPPIDPVFFATPAAFRQWLRNQHKTATEVWVCYYKKASGHPSITYHESLDEALCFGWIDGIRKSIDGERYMNRFTPRRRGSNWSLVNVRKVTDLIAAGRMQPAGLAAYQAREAKKTGVYSFENKPTAFTPALTAMFQKHALAWRFWEAQPPGYRRTMTFYVMSATREETLHRIQKTTHALYDFAGSQFIYLQNLVNLIGPSVALMLLSTITGSLAVAGFLIVGFVIGRFDKVLMTLVSDLFHKQRRGLPARVEPTVARF